MTKPFFTATMDQVESGADHVAAQVLLIGLKHIKKHRMSHPLDTSPEEWFDEIIPELIWYCEFITEGDNRNGILQTEADQARFREAGHLLGNHFHDIWC